MQKTVLTKRIVAVICALAMLFVSYISGLMIVQATAEDYELNLKSLGAGNGATTTSYDEATGISKIDYSGQMWLYWTLWTTDAWSTSQSAIDISKYKYLTMTVQMTTGNPFAVAASPVFNLANDGGEAISNPWTGATVNTAGLKALPVSEDWVTISLPLDTTNLQSFFYAIILCDSCGAGSLSVKDMRLTVDEYTEETEDDSPINEKGEYLLDLSSSVFGNGNSANGSTFSYDEESKEVTVVFNGQLWAYWTLWNTSAWADKPVDASSYQYLTMKMKLEDGVNPFAQAASSTFNLANDGGIAISNPWTGIKVQTTKLAAITKEDGWVTVSLPLEFSDISSFYYFIMLCDSCGAGTVKFSDMRLTVDDYTEEVEDDSPINEKGEYRLDLSNSAFGSGNGEKGGIFSYDEETEEATVVFNGQLWAYWTLWNTPIWTKNNSAIDISSYRYLTMKMKLEDGNNPFAQAASPTFNLVNDGGVAVNNPWTGIKIGTAKLAAVTKENGWVTLSLPIENSDISSFYYFIMLCDSCGSGTVKFADMRLTTEDYTDEAFKDVEDDTADADGKLLAKAWDSGYASTTVTTDPQSGIITVDYNGMLWMYWVGWNAKGYTGSAYPIGDYKYITMTMKMTGNNPFATSNDAIFNLCNDGAATISHPDKGAAAKLDVLKKVSADGEWFTISLPIDSLTYQDYYYAVILAQNCGAGQLQMKDICLTADDRTTVYTGEPWDDSYGYWLPASGWDNQYPQGSTYTKDITDDTLNVFINGQPMYLWTAWHDGNDDAVIDLSDYRYLTFQIKMNGGNPFQKARDNATTVGFFICDEDGKQVSDPWGFGSAVLDNVCAVKTSDEWVTVSLSLKDVEQSTMRYIYVCAENVGIDYGFSIRNMCLTATDKTEQKILKRVAEEKETNDPNAEDKFTDPDDTLDDYITASGGSDGNNGENKTDTPKTGDAKYPIVATALAIVAVLGGLLFVRKKKA